MDPVIRNILDVAVAEFAEHGLAGARVDAIAARTRTSKRMLYYHFGSKEGLYAAALADAYAGVRTHTTVTHVRMIGKDVALADVSYALEGGKVDSIRRGSMAFVLRKDAGRWRIAAIRSIPERST